MRLLTRTRAALAAALLAALFAGGCSVNPATGRQSLSLMSAAEEQQIGAQAHPDLVAEFGGEHPDPRIRDYVRRMGGRLAANSEMAGQTFTFTVLNSDIPNAFALPGGYVYVTSGLMALANSEAELAGVIGHEIGHVTARHTAERYSQSVMAELGVGLLAVLTGSQAAANLGALGAGAYLSGYSREQESEADFLGVRYMSRAGYDPQAMASFLSAMQGQDEVDRLILGRGDDGYGLFSTHPRTEQRVQDAIRLVAAQGGPAGGTVGREDYLSVLDGMYYGGDPENGFVRGRRFVHPALRFEFTVPPGFTILNSSDAVQAMGPGGAMMTMDAGGNVPRGRVATYMVRSWLDGMRVSGVETIEVNGMEAATAYTRASARGRPVDVRFVVIRHPGGMAYRLVFVAPEGAGGAMDAFRGTTYSFRALSQAEAARVEPYRIRARRVGRGDTVASLAARMPFEDYRVQRFLALNGMKPGQEVVPGQMVKLIAD